MSGTTLWMLAAHTTAAGRYYGKPDSQAFTPALGWFNVSSKQNWCRRYVKSGEKRISAINVDQGPCRKIWRMLFRTAFVLSQGLTTFILVKANTNNPWLLSKGQIPSEGRDTYYCHEKALPATEVDTLSQYQVYLTSFACNNRNMRPPITVPALQMLRSEEHRPKQLPI